MATRTLNCYIYNIEKSSYVLGSELRESKFDRLVKEYIYIFYCRRVGNTKT